MKIITGACGFIGSCLISYLNKMGQADIILVDDFSNEIKSFNLIGKQYRDKIDRADFIVWLSKNYKDIKEIYHMGARTDTTEDSHEIFNTLNLNYSKSLWYICSAHDIPFIYASSAATYGDGKLGYNDDHEIVDKLNPLNPYGVSKNEFDKSVLQQDTSPSFWAGVKFFNVYGPNEYHKGRMASVILHSCKNVINNNHIKLFRSHNPSYKDGEQVRDFIYVMDVGDVLYFMMKKKPASAIYNLGTGNERTFHDLASSVFCALHREKSISFIDTPEDIRDRYQYFTKANMKKLRSIGYNRQFYSLEEGVDDYIRNYLLPNNFL